MTILGPNDPRAVQQVRCYTITFTDPDGNEREFHKETVWTEARAMCNEIRKLGAVNISLSWDDHLMHLTAK